MSAAPVVVVLPNHGDLISTIQTTLQSQANEINACKPQVGSFLGRKITVIQSGGAIAVNAGTTAEKIQKLTLINDILEALSLEFDMNMKGADQKWTMHIASVDNTITRLKALCESYLKEHQSVAALQK